MKNNSVVYSFKVYSIQNLLCHLYAVSCILLNKHNTQLFQKKKNPINLKKFNNIDSSDMCAKNSLQYF